MKIVIFTSYLMPHIGGIEVVAADEAKAFVDAGQSATIITSACESRPGVSNVKGYEVRRVRAWNFLERKLSAAFPIFAPSMFWHAYKAVQDADIVHVHDAFYISSLAGAFWARVLRKPLILTQHIDFISHKNRAIRIAQRLIYATTGKFVMQSSAKIIVLNSRVKEFLIARGVNESRIIFLPNSVDTKLFLPANQKDKIMLRRKYGMPIDATLALFVGRFVPKKGFTKLLNLNPIRDVAFVFVGGEAPAGDKRKDHFFLGRIGRDKIADVFKLCDVFILPSQDEGFPLTVQEAMASGLPIITSNDPAYSPYHFNQENILLIRPTPPTITKTIRELIKDDGRQRRMSQYSRQYAMGNFNWQVGVDKLLTIYQEVAT